MEYKPDYEELEIKIKKLEKEIRKRKKSSKHQDFISNNIPDVIFKLDPKGIITYINKAVGIYCYLPEDLIGKNIFKIVHPDDIEKAIHRINERRTGERSTKDLQIRLFTKAGEERTFASRAGIGETSFFYITAEGIYSSDESSPGVFLGTQVIARDITELKEAEEDKIHLREKLIHAQKMENIGTLTGDIAHDFNNILGVILGNLDIIKMNNEPLSTNVKHHIEEGITAAKRGAHLIEKLLTFSQQRKDEKKGFYVQLIIKEALKFLRASIPSTINIEDDIYQYKSMIFGDPTNIYQIVMNLCTNAYHAMDKTGGTLKVILDKITFSKEDLVFFPELKRGDYVHLSVSDTGHGIKKDVMDNIFDPFFATKKDDKGTGLGLSTVYGIIKDYSGTIKVYSEVGKGTKFDIYIPEYKEEIRAREDTAKESITRGNGTILLIDDDKAMLNTVEMSLVLLGYNVMSFEDSQEALEVFKSEPDKFDLVMTDLIMPNLTGDQLVDKIHEIKSDIPIILSSGLVIEEEKSDIIYLSKPYDLVTISKIISENIGLRKRH